MPDGDHKEKERAKVLSTHFRLLVVSDRFQHLSYLERVGIVYDVLLKELGTNCLSPPHSQLGRCAPLKMKMVFFLIT